MVRRVHRLRVGDAVGDVEARVEDVRRREDVGVEEVEQRPQLGEVVLERRAREQERGGEVHLAHGRRDVRLDRLDDVALVED